MVNYCNLKKKIIYYFIIPLFFALLTIFILILLNQLGFIYLKEVIFNPGNYSLNPFISWGILVYIIVSGILLQYDYKLRALLNLENEYDFDEIFKNKYQKIINGELEEHDLIKEIDSKKSKFYLKKKVKKLRNFYDITDVKYYYMNPKNIFHLRHSFSILPFFTYSKYFCECKINHDFIDKIYVSYSDLCFIVIGYIGKKIVLNYDNIFEKRLIKPGSRPFSPETERSKEIYEKINSYEKLYNKIHKLMKRAGMSFELVTRKRTLTFNEYKEFLKQNIYRADKIEQVFDIKEKESLLVFKYHSNWAADDIKIKQKFLELSEDLIKIALG